MPKSSTPALLDAKVRSLVPASRIAASSSSGMPHRPNPPAAMNMPSNSSPSRAEAASGWTLCIDCPFVAGGRAG